MKDRSRINRRTFLKIVPAIASVAGAVSGATEVVCPSADHESIDVRSLAATWNGATPTQWGMKVPGVVMRFVSHGLELALTFDACGGGCDEEMLAVLKEEQVPATFFLAGPWLRSNRTILSDVTGDPLFEVENHGLNHRPLSVTGRSAYGIQGTKNPEEVISEIMENAKAIEAVTGVYPTLFRPACAHCDDIAVKIAKALGCVIFTFRVNGDEGGTLTGARLISTITQTDSGDIVLLHINRPGHGRAPALRKAISVLRAKGFAFVKLKDRELIEA